MAVIKIGNVTINTRKITKLPEGSPSKKSLGVFADDSGQAYQFELGDLEGILDFDSNNPLDFTDEDKANIRRPTQTVAEVKIDGDFTGIGKDQPIKAELKYKDENGVEFKKYIDIEWQGNTSLGYPKKNYSIDIYNDEDHDDEFKIKFGDWVPLESFHLKSTYTDPLAVRDVLCARLLQKCWLTRSYMQAFPWSKPYDYSASVEDIRPSGARGVTDGFPIELKINGENQGLYIWQLPRKRQNYNMDKDTTTQILATADETIPYSFPTSAPYFRPQYWDLKNPKYDTLPPDVSNNMERMLAFMLGSTQAEFNDHVHEYFNLDLCIDYHIQIILTLATDNRLKNLTLVTYDGLIWAPVLWDNDRTIGARHVAPTFDLLVDGSVFSDIYDPQVWSQSPLFVKLITGFKPQFDARYKELREKVFNLNVIQKEAMEIVNQVPFKLYEKDFEIWGGNAQHRVFSSSIGQISDYMLDRFTYIDPQFNYTP